MAGTVVRIRSSGMVLASGMVRGRLLPSEAVKDLARGALEWSETGASMGGVGGARGSWGAETAA